MTTFETIVALIGSVTGSSVLTVLIQSWFVKRKTDADAASVTVETVLKWANGLTLRIDALEKALSERDLLIAGLREQLARLEAKVGA